MSLTNAKNAHSVTLNGICVEWKLVKSEKLFSLNAEYRFTLNTPETGQHQVKLHKGVQRVLCKIVVN